MSYKSNFVNSKLNPQPYLTDEIISSQDPTREIRVGNIAR